MATTTRPERLFRRALRRSSGAGRVVLVCQLLLAWGGPVAAEGLRVEPGITLAVVSSSNPGLQANPRADIVLTTSPRLNLTGSGAAYRINGSIGLDATTHFLRTAVDRLTPRIQTDSTLRVIDRLLFLDVGLSASTSVDNPYGVAVGNPENLNQATTWRERISPYVERELDPDTRFSARTDHNWLQLRGGSTTVSTRSDAYADTQTVRYARRPTPTGWQAEFNREATRLNGVGSQSTEQYSLRLTPVYAPEPNVQVGLVAGIDSASDDTTSRTRALYGAGVRWTPSDRTTLDSRIEQRFFGLGGRFDLTHRSPLFSANLALSRSASSYIGQLVTVPAGADVAQLLDAALTTRIPDPIQRAATVRDYMAQRGLPGSLGSALSLGAGGLQRLESASLSLALLGVRHTVALRVYAQRTSDLIEDGTVAPLLSGNARQRGETLTLNRRLASDTSADVSLARSRIQGFGPNAASRATTLAVQASLSHRISPRTDVTVGVRHQTLDSSVVASATDNALTASVNHRF